MKFYLFCTGLLLALMLSACPMDCRDGKDGADGKDGKDGVNGMDGADGKDGEDGKCALAVSSGRAVT